MIKALNNAFERRNKRQEENAKFAREMAKEAFKNKLLIQREEAKARMQQGILPSAESEAGLKTRQESMIKSPEMQFEMPAEKVGRTSTGRPVAKQTTEADKQMSFMNAYQRVISQGKTPPSWATKVFEKYKAKQNQRMTGKEGEEQFSFLEEETSKKQPEKKSWSWSNLFTAENGQNANITKTPYKQFGKDWYRKVSGGWQLIEENEKKRAGLQ